MRESKCKYIVSLLCFTLYCLANSPFILPACSWCSSQIAHSYSHGRIKKLSSLKTNLPSKEGEVQSDQCAHWYAQVPMRAEVLPQTAGKRSLSYCNQSVKVAFQVSVQKFDANLIKSDKHLSLHCSRIQNECNQKVIKLYELRQIYFCNHRNKKTN